MILYSFIETFLENQIKKQRPFLLALSGGSDSLYLFYCLLRFREQHAITFHVAHVDHGWRDESRQECIDLHQLAQSHAVPFHSRVLDPTQLKGNLEATCREARYRFFKELCDTHALEGVITGHHRDDRSETTFKRMMEGSHWLKWDTLKNVSYLNGLLILRPLLPFHKAQIVHEMTQMKKNFFSDSSNSDPRFLRSRLRETLIPSLDETFGKKVEPSLHTIANEMSELSEYFKNKLRTVLESTVRGPLGSYLDCQSLTSQHLLETKILLRLFAENEHISLSREIIDRAANALHKREANIHFAMGGVELMADRGLLFLHHDQKEFLHENFTQELTLGLSTFRGWSLFVSEKIASGNEKTWGWKEGWKEGKMIAYFPLIPIQIASYSRQYSQASLKKKWNHAKVPAFLYSRFPLMISEGEIVHEFLSGRSKFHFHPGEKILCCEMILKGKHHAF